jgi:Tol biopolymer transport system component
MTPVADVEQTFVGNVMIGIARVCALLLLGGAIGQSTEGLDGTMVFAANPDGHWALFIYKSAAEPRRLTTHAMDSRTPALSPDSRRLVYVTSDGSLWMLDVASAEPRKMAAPFSNGRYGFPTWLSRDVIAYTTYVVTPPTEDSDIYSYSFADVKQKRLIKQTGSQDFVSASGSGNWVAFMSSVTTEMADFGSTITQQLWTASLKTGKIDQLTSGGFRDSKPSWSPNEKRIAFSSDRSGNPNIWVIDVESKVLTQETNGPGENTDPCWSPDGRQIAYVSTTSGRHELNLIDIETRKITTLHPFGSKAVEIRDPAWGK